MEKYHEFEPHFNIVEIFESLQGEGFNTGMPSIFVRFGKCNLDCPGVIRLIMILNAGLHHRFWKKCGPFHQGILSSLVVSQQLCQKLNTYLSNLKQMAIFLQLKLMV